MLYLYVVKRGLEGEAIDLLVNLYSCPHLWLWAVGGDWKTKTEETNSRNELSPKSFWAQPYRQVQELGQLALNVGF